LSYGTQKRVEIARALMAQPVPPPGRAAGGLNHEEVEELGDFVVKLRDERALAILLVEHHTTLVMRVSDHVNVLSFGRKIASGRPPRCRPSPPDRGVPRGGGVSVLLALDDVEARYGPCRHSAASRWRCPRRDRRRARRERGGKTTTLRAVSGTVRRTGRIDFGGSAARRAEAVARAGIAHVPEGRGTFTERAVTENLKLGAYTRRDRSLRADIDRISPFPPWIPDRASQPARTLSEESSRCSRSHALMARPACSCSTSRRSGRADDRSRDLPDRARAERKGRLTVLVVEQDARIALRRALERHVLEVGASPSPARATAQENESVGGATWATDGGLQQQVVAGLASGSTASPPSPSS
jgi:branched-chain amino acid transport system ATP-binding protein